MVSVQCYMFVCRLVISVQGVIIIDLSSLGCIVPEILKSIKKSIVLSKWPQGFKQIIVMLPFGYCSHCVV